MINDSAGRKQRFVDRTATADRMHAARSYTTNLAPAEIAWLYRKPFRIGTPTEFLSEIYSVLNLLQILNLEENNCVLEVGSGPGWVTELLALLGVNVTCVEPAADMINIARERLASTFAHHRITNPPRIEFVQSGLEEANLPSDFFDAAIFHEALHHVVDERACLSITHRSLKKGGRLGVCEWCWIPGDYGLESALTKEMQRFGTLESPFTQDYLDEILKTVGFVDVTRYHSINGFIPVELGGRTIQALAQAPATRTNNLTAVKPYGVPTSRTYDAIRGDEIIVAAKNVAWSEGNRAVRITVSISNMGSVVLLNHGIGGITISLCSGPLGKPKFIEAGRVPLPRSLMPGDEISFDCDFFLPSDAHQQAWRLELVAEHVKWLDQKSKPQIGIGR